MTHVIIYDDTPRPSFWRHPIRWWKWKHGRVIGWIDLGDGIPMPPESGLTITWGNLSNKADVKKEKTDER